MIANFDTVLVLGGVWVTSKMDWFAEDNASIVSLMQQLVFSCIPLPAATVVMMVVVQEVSIINLAFYLAVFLVIVQASVNCAEVKARAHWESAKHRAPAEYVVGSVTMGMLTIATYIFPTVFHFILHRRSMDTKFGPARVPIFFLAFVFLFLH